MRKIKIVWICHFSNNQIREKLPLSSIWFSNLLIRIFGNRMIFRYTDFAPWINTLIKEFERLDEIELHIIAPHRGLKRLIYEFALNGIHYHFFRPGISTIVDKTIKKLFKLKPNYTLNRLLVKRTLKKINPDIVNLIGAENPYYSSTALDISRTPLYVLLQTVLSTPFNDKHNYFVDKNLLRVEKEIFLATEYFGTASRVYHDCVTKLNPKANVFEFWFPTIKPPEVGIQVKKFDFVFFSSQIKQSKGIEDAIDALSIVQKNYRDVKLNIIGSCSSSYKKMLDAKISDLGLKENITFSNYFPTHTEMFKQVMKSKIALLPHKIDVISSTIREAMFMGLPIVTYKTTGTPLLNSVNQTVLISDIGDIQHLAFNMLKLLDDPDLALSLSRNAKELAERLFDNTMIAKKLIRDYEAIINHYTLKTPIPEDLLLKPEKFPVY